MLRQVGINTQKKSMAEWLIIVIVITILMANAIQYFFKQENQIADAGFQALANNFSAQVKAIHAQWLMDGRPKNVLLKEISGNQTLATVNQYGWVNGVTCHKTWQQVMGIPLEFLKQPISVVELISNEKTHSMCRFVLNKEIYFDYDLLTGKVNNS